MSNLETVLSLHSKRYDTPKKLNRSPRVIRDTDFFSLLKTEGLTSEYIKEFKHPIFKYTGQITLHGIFEHADRVKVGGYQNVIINKNGSIGIKYNAIDYKKKKELARYLHVYEFGYCRDSRGDQYQRSFYDKASCLECWNKITLDNFYCSKFVFRNPLTGIYSIVININALLETEFWPVFTAITGETKEQAEARLTAYEAKQQAASDQWEREREAERQETEKRREGAREMLDRDFKPIIAHLPEYNGTFIKDLVIVRAAYDSQFKGLFAYYRLQKAGAYYTAKKVSSEELTISPNFDTYRADNISDKDFSKVLRRIRSVADNNVFKVLKSA